MSLGQRLLQFFPEGLFALEASRTHFPRIMLGAWRPGLSAPTPRIRVCSLFWNLEPVPSQVSRGL